MFGGGSKNPNHNKNKTTIVTILLLITIIIGASYALWTYNYKGTDKNNIVTSDWSFRLLESNNEIFNIKPMPDEEGMTQTEKGSILDFEVRSRIEADTDIKYTVSLTKLDPDEGMTQIPDEEVKIYIEDFDGNTILEPTKVSDLKNYVLFEKIHRHSGTKKEISTKYKLKVWLDESVSVFDNENRQFKFKIGVVNRQLKQEAKTYKLIYNTNGGEGTIPNDSFVSGESITITNNKPTRTGYTFLGWSRNKKSGTATYTSGEKETFSNVYDDSIILYAVWKANTNTTYKVEHYLMDTKGNYQKDATSIENKTGTTGETLKLEDLKKTTIDYNVENGIEYSYGKDENDIVTTTKIAPDGSKVIKLYYERTYGILTTIKGENINSVTEQNNVKYYYGSKVPTLTATLNNETGYTIKFNKWTSNHPEYLKNQQANPLDTITWPAMPKDTNITLTASATKTVNNYKVTYDYKTNGGETSTKETQNIAYGSSIDLTPVATKTGWTFLGWNTDKTAKVALKNYTMPSNDITLYAIYKKEAKTYTATTQKNVTSATGTSTTVSCTIKEVYNTETQATSCTIKLPTNPYTLTGWTFNGWTQEKTSTTTTATNGKSENEEMTISEDVNIVATWTKIDEATWYYYNGSTNTSKTSTCTKYNGESTCTFTIPSEVSTSSGPKKETYVGVSTNLSSMTVTTNYTSNNTNYYAVYRSSVKVYRPTSTSVASLLTLYRNSYFTSTTSMNTVLANSNTGTSTITSITGLIGTLKGFSSAVNTSAITFQSINNLLNSTSTTVYAVSTQNIKVKYNANGGSGAPSSQTTTRTIYCTSTSKATITGNTTISSTIPTKEGYVFLGWYENTTSKYDSNATYKDHPLYYYADTYSDLYNAFGYNEQQLYNHYYTYILNGSESRTVAPYEKGKTYDISTNKTLYAGWHIKSYTVNLTVINGTISGDATKSIVHGNNAAFTSVPASSSYDLAAYACNKSKKPTFTNNNTLTVPNITENINCTVEYHKSAVKELLEKVGSDSTQPIALKQAATATTPSLTEYRYMGKSPKNYIDLGYWNETLTGSNNSFLASQYRIMGIFYTEDENDNYNYRLKATRDHAQSTQSGFSNGNPTYSTLAISWNTSSSSINSGYGSNQWGPSGSYKGSAMMKLLNPGYSSESIGGSIWWPDGTVQGKCYNGQNNASTNCSFYENYMVYPDYIDTVKWYLGATAYQIDTPTAYKQERGTTVGYTDTGQTIIKTNTWIGKVGLPYESDYGYASSTCYKDGTVLYWTNGVDYRQTKCTNTNWIYRPGESASTWLMTPDIGGPQLSSGASYPKGAWVKQISKVGGTSGRVPSTAQYFRPTFYLKPEVMFDYEESTNTGTNSKSDVYKVTDISVYQKALESSMK